MKIENDLRTRQCIACRRMVEKRNLIRFAKDKDGRVFRDTTLKAGGRGAYICKNPDCLKKAIKVNSLSKVFKTYVDSAILKEVSCDE